MAGKPHQGTSRLLINFILLPMKTNKSAPSAPLNLCPPTGVSSAPREVFIRMVRDCWMVLYVNRKPGSRHSPGQFHAPSHSLDYVKAWVTSNPKLKLVESKEKTVKCVSYFYPTSDNAKRFNLPEGGFGVGLTVLSTEKDSCTTEACAGFATEAEAMAHAETLPFEWASWQGKKGLAPMPASPVKDTPADPLEGLNEDEIGLRHAQSWSKAGIPDLGAHLDAPASPVDSVRVSDKYTWTKLEVAASEFDHAQAVICDADGFKVATCSLNFAREAVQVYRSHAAKDAKIKALEQALKDCVESLSRLPDTDGAYRVTCLESAKAALALPCASQES